MIAGLKPYGEYREAGWLGKVPAHWTTKRTKYILQEVDTRSATGKEQLLRVSQYSGVTERKQIGGADGQDTRAESLVGYKRVSPDDLVVNIMLAWNGSLGVSIFAGITSPAYCVYRFSPGILPQYFHNLFRSEAYKTRIKTISTGVVESRLRLYSESLFRMESLLPPPSEQAAIVRFLTWAHHRLDRTIAAKRKTIALLNEQKQAIIHRAVTRGLDPNAKLKPSGLAWLGEIPEGWEILRSKYIYREVDSRSTSGLETHLSMSQKHGLIPSSNMEVRRLMSESQIGAKLCSSGDLVLNRLKAHLGVFALAKEPGNVSPDYTVLRPQREIEATYFEFIYRGPACRIELRKLAKGIVEGFWRLYTDDFYNIKVPFPPLSEQTRIIENLDWQLVSVNDAISRLEQEIVLLKEYRTRLTADVVTGKLDVREAAARLPDNEDVSLNDETPEIPSEDEEEDA